MYVDTATYERSGKIHKRYLLRASYRENGKVKKKTIAKSCCEIKKIIENIYNNIRIAFKKVKEC